MRFYKICKCFILKKCIFYVIQKSLFIYYRCDVPRRFERIDGAFMFKILMKGKNMKIEKKNLNEALKVLGKVNARRRTTVSCSSRSLRSKTFNVKWLSSSQ